MELFLQIEEQVLGFLFLIADRFLKQSLQGFTLQSGGHDAFAAQDGLHQFRMGFPRVFRIVQQAVDVPAVLGKGGKEESLGGSGNNPVPSQRSHSLFSGFVMETRIRQSDRTNGAQNVFKGFLRLIQLEIVPGSLHDVIGIGEQQDQKITLGLVRVDDLTIECLDELVILQTAPLQIHQHGLPALGSDLFSLKSQFQQMVAPGAGKDLLGNFQVFKELGFLQVQKGFTIGGDNLLLTVDIAAADLADGAVILLQAFFQFKNIFMLQVVFPFDSCLARYGHAYYYTIFLSGHSGLRITSFAHCSLGSACVVESFSPQQKNCRNRFSGFPDIVSSCRLCAVPN